jgi:hypothetical protein
MDTGPVLIAAVLHTIKHVCANPYRIPHNKTLISICHVHLFPKKSKKHNTSEHTKLNLKILFLQFASDFRSNILLNDAARTDNPSIQFIILLPTF